MESLPDRVDQGETVHGAPASAALVAGTASAVTFGRRIRRPPALVLRETWAWKSGGSGICS